MRSKRVKVIAILATIFLSVMISAAGAVTFSSPGQGSSSGPTYNKPEKQKRDSGEATKLDLPGEEGKRVAEAFEMTRLTGIQAKLALQELTDLDGKIVPAPEVEARLEYAYQSLEALEKSSKKLEDSVKLAELAYGKTIYMEKNPLLFFGATPAWAWGTKDALKSLSKAAKTMGKYATKLKNAVKSGIGKVTGVVGTVHTKIGNLVGQRNWATIMATTKCVAAVAGTFVGVAIAAPTTVAGAAFVSVAFIAGTAGAAMSFANDMSEISNQKKPFGSTVGNINKGFGLIGIVTSGSPGEVFVNVISVAGDDVVETTPGRPMSKEEMKDYLRKHDSKMDKKGFKKEYKEPDDRHDGEGGDGSSGGCGGGCGS